ncbi:hypothetical protein [Cupriavidus sp. L7L]|uniref:hypothetical protein n=1 Tax=Cupriavidus sp. L7L TaxID=2546443 RepID=UPI0010550F1D|nr:hypothetical protein [Cupriavidus sp. L7L]TDF64528.1 hypothetical protein E1J61_18240 [Cupriavidus sp. L7L]
MRLAPGQTLAGDGKGAVIRFAQGSDGVQLSADNAIVDLHVETSPEKRAIFNDTGVESLGRLRLANVSTIGQVQLFAREKVRARHVAVDGLDVIAADARGQSDRPQGHGVHVTQGGFTLWNMQADPNVVISAQLKGLSAGQGLPRFFHRRGSRKPA